MTLAAIDLLVAIVAGGPADLGGLDALGVDAGRTGRFLPSGLGADLAAQGVENPLPGAVLLPGGEVIPDRALGQQIMWQHVPLHPCTVLVEQRVEHLAHVGRARPASMLGRWDQRLQQGPLGVSHIGLVALPHWSHSYQPVLGRNSLPPLNSTAGRAFRIVSQWCEDPFGAAGGSSRMNRGGCWHDDGIDCRASKSTRSPPSNRSFMVGFRLA